MQQVVELRIHGVGGATPEGLLGVASADDTVLVAGAGSRYPYFSARRAPRPPYVEGYLWGALTSRPWLQPLWIVLLPFTLLNVAGWMHPKRRQGDPRLGFWAASRLVLVLLGLGLTVSYALWLSFIVTAVVGPAWPAWAPPALLAVITVAIYMIARFTQEAFEGVSPPECPDNGTGDTTKPKSADQFLGNEGLADPAFWSRARGTTKLLSIHLAAFALVAVGTSMLIPTLVVPGENVSGPFVALIDTVALVQLGVVLLLALVVALGWRHPFQWDRFRVLAPAVATGAAVALTNGLFSALATVVRSSLNPQCDSVTSCFSYVVRSIGAPGGEGGFLNLSWAFGFAITVTVAVILGQLVIGALKLRGDHREIKRDEELIQPKDAPPGREATGVSDFRSWLLAIARRSTGTLRQVDLPLTTLAAGFLVGAVWSWATSGPDTGIFDWIGRVVLTVMVLLLLVFLWRRARRPADRRKVGILWDVLTFWPRRFHPFAIRPYAERAVPELEHRLVHHVGEANHSVLLLAHSQGSVLAYAALLQLARCRDITSRIAVITYGSPLYQLYQRFFPDYFQLDAQFARLLDSLYPAGTHFWTWRNFYRRTDYVGQAIFQDTLWKDCDICLSDPASDPEIRARLIDQAVPGQPDINRVAWVDVAAHSWYRNEIRLKQWLEATRTELEQAQACQ
jgi:hypothetical protein